jgi:aryl-alcohol dehydrogenase-like predicted oxidoreductase
MFRKNWNYNPALQNKANTLANMEDCLAALQKQVDKGNIRHFGLSNESAWGTAQWLRLSEDRGLPRVATIQNEYSLLCRLYDTDLAELSVNEDVGLITFSPLATGLLTGKYQNSAIPEGSRKSLSPDLGAAPQTGFGLQLMLIWQLQPNMTSILYICHLHGALLDPSCVLRFLGQHVMNSLSIFSK